MCHVPVSLSGHSLLNVSERTLYRRVREFDMDGSFSEISNTELDELLKSMMAVTPRVVWEQL